eukprot:CAMPEP_0171101994 /NCGR_PEP_ID=MMETSP0766_2-20121228/56530_1 /TAXON_ID=439317 /ORGANISM="Gambierdiscus australes, Strain CAWD 149" /LENGTH=215 /DNA_ID=CAMNT_0011562167 /DNA_START=122 /DNA_END=769 /DNA_ORIENTATION=+
MTWALCSVSFVTMWRSIQPSSRRVAVQRRANMIQIPGGIKNGLKLLIDGDPVQVQSFLSKKQGKGVAITKTKVRNLLTGATVEKTLQSGSKYEVIETEWRKATYSYFNEDANAYMFMDDLTFEEVEMSADVLGDAAEWLTDGVEVDLEMYDDKFVQFQFRKDLVLEVETVIDSGREDGQKQVILANGIKKMGANYLKVGDMVQIHPTSFEIIKRV